MILATVDFETYYAQDYSLSKMTTEEYINDPRFQIIGVSVKLGSAPPRWVSFPTLKEYSNYLRHLNDCGVVCHHVKFDAAILAWRLGIKPKFLFDTLGMSRAIYGMTVRHDLGTLAKRLGVGVKGKEVLTAKGKRLEDFTKDELAAYGGYCDNDVALTDAAFKKMARGYPQSELRRIDLTARMYTQPLLVLDKGKIEREIFLEAERKQTLLDKLDGTALAGDLTSNDRFAEVLRNLGVEPPTKVSIKKSEAAGEPVRTWAFAKSDADFKHLLKHDDDLVVAAVEARLGHKSTQKATRAQRFLGIANRMGILPVPLGYYKAHTGRYGGEDKINLQNLPGARGSDDPDVALLRKAITAPPGCVIPVADLSQIEARLLVWQANQMDKVEAFAQGRDVYSEQASTIYSRPVDRKKVKDDYIPGFVGKCTVLGCGYGLGHLKFGGMIYVGMLGGPSVTFDEGFAESLHVDPMEYAYWLKQQDKDFRARLREARPLEMSKGQWVLHLSSAKRVIDVYRADNDKVKAYWRTLNSAIEAMYMGEVFEFGGPNHNLLRTERESIILPNGMRLLYTDMEFKDGQYSCMRFREGRPQRVKMYGGGLAENVTQALGNIIMGDAMLKADEAGYRVLLQSHDEMATVAPEEEASEALNKMLGWMRVPPAWAPGLPLDAEGDFAFSYGDAK